MSSILNTREQAILIWITLLILALFITPKGRQAFWPVLRAFLVRPILLIYGAMITYLCIAIYYLYSIHYWHITSLKTTFVWFLTYAFISLPKINTLAKDPRYFTNKLKEAFQVIVLVEFIVNFYTFHIVIELILIPTVVFLTIVDVISENDPLHKTVNILTNSLMAFIGFAMTAYVVYMIILEPNQLFSLKTVNDFTLPIILTLLLFPFLYFVALYMTYETKFTKIDFIIKKNEKLQKYAKWTAIKNFHLNRTALMGWVDFLAFYDIQNRANIQKSVDEYKFVKEAEKSPKDIPSSEGWSPFLAQKFLNTLGIVTKDYHPNSYDETWTAISNFLELPSDSPLPCNISYYIEGSKTVAKKLKLTLNINPNNSHAVAQDEFLKVAKVMYQKACNKELPKKISLAIKNAQNSNHSYHNTKTSLVKHLWGNDDGQTLELTISHISS